MTPHVGVVVEDRGAAVVTVERHDDGRLVCAGVERLPFDLGAVALRARELEAALPDARWVVDADGLGTALWTVLGHEGDPRWALYRGRGVERQALVDGLLVAVERDLFRFAPGLAEQEAMSKALVAHRRHVRDDGDIGAPLVVALLLAVIPPPREPVPLIAYGRPLGRLGG